MNKFNRKTDQSKGSNPVVLVVNDDADNIKEAEC
jgi:hypothetical protein